MKSTFRSLYVNAMQAHAGLTEELNALHEWLKTETDVEQLVDLGYTLREVGALAKAVQVLADKVGFSTMYQIGARFAADPSIGDKVKTFHCSATITVKSTVSPPTLAKHPEAYTELMVGHFGLPEKLVEMEVIRPHFPGLCEYVTELQTAGTPLPEGLDPNRVKEQVHVAYRRKRGITETTTGGGTA